MLGIEGAVPIKELEPGDEVLATEVRGLRALDDDSLRRVEQVFVCETSVVVEVTFRLPDGQLDVLVGTPNHPVYDSTRNRWRPLSSLGAGDTLTGATGEVEVVARRLISGSFEVFNLEVAGDHSFRVGRASLLVHNGKKKHCGRRRRSGAEIQQQQETINYEQYKRRKNGEGEGLANVDKSDDDLDHALSRIKEVSDADDFD